MRGAAAGRSTAVGERQGVAVLIRQDADGAFHVDAGGGVEQDHAVAGDAGIGRDHTLRADIDHVAVHHDDTARGLDQAVVGDLTGALNVPAYGDPALDGVGLRILLNLKADAAESIS